MGSRWSRFDVGRSRTIDGHNGPPQHKDFEPQGLQALGVRKSRMFEEPRIRLNTDLVLD